MAFEGFPLVLLVLVVLVPSAFSELRRARSSLATRKILTLVFTLKYRNVNGWRTVDYGGVGYYCCFKNDKNKCTTWTHLLPANVLGELPAVVLLLQRFLHVHVSPYSQVLDHHNSTSHVIIYRRRRHRNKLDSVQRDTFQNRGSSFGQNNISEELPPYS